MDTTEDQIYQGLDEKKHVNDYVGDRFLEVVAGLDDGYRDKLFCCYWV